MDTLYKTEKHFVESNHVINGYTPLTLSREIDDKLESFISEKRLTDNSEVMINENKLKRALTDYFFQMDFLDYEFEYECDSDVNPLYQLLDYMIDAERFFVSMKNESPSINNHTWYECIDNKGDLYFVNFMNEKE